MQNKYEICGSLDIIYHKNVTGNDLRGISTPSENIAWLSGNNGTIIRTIDGGVTWSVKGIPGAEKLDFRDIKAFDENIAYVMSVGYGKDSCIYKTTNGGQTWVLQLQGQHSSEFFNCMAFWNQHHGLVLCDPQENKFKLYTIKDGETWLPIPSDAILTASDGEGAFAASGSCMTVYGDTNVWFGTGVNNARVFRSINNGFNWTVAETPIKKDNYSSGIFSIAFSDLNHGMIAGGDFNNPDMGGPNLAVTIDGGASWASLAISPQHYWSAISFTPDKRNFMVVGSTHAGYASSFFGKPFPISDDCKIDKEAETSDSCLIWERSLNNVNLNAFSFWKKDSALAVGPKGNIAEIKIPCQKL
ncbi:WD40/YVTN/BNR-like repeat-containing protein [Legionella gresilensis]|uniref:WD40/YVTN/BNR-like repeat-containing protein n=1 Tax=Legionella gresilensis TaxID=91823 RepID=UPI0010419A01|nr:glycosyl hydrolase [Legionella gresilensis]